MLYVFSERKNCWHCVWFQFLHPRFVAQELRLPVFFEAVALEVVFTDYESLARYERFKIEFGVPNVVNPFLANIWPLLWIRNHKKTPVVSRIWLVGASKCLTNGHLFALKLCLCVCINTIMGARTCISVG